MNNQPFASPYMPYPQVVPMPQAMAPMPQQAPQGMTGRVVASIDEVVPNEVPTDGSFGFFPVRDGSAIYAKTWRSDGTIATVRFAPVDEQQKGDQGPTLADIADQLSDMQDALDELRKPKKAAKKGASDDA